MTRLIKTGALATGENWRDHWKTPPHIIEAINQMWPDGWHDPCPANPQHDALSDECDWNAGGPLYINPPFSQYRAWVDKWTNEARPEAIWLCHHSHDTSWFQGLTSGEPENTAICLLRGRLRFIDPRTGDPSASTAIGKCQSLIYYGRMEGHRRFFETFSPLGLVLKPDWRHAFV